MSWRHLSISGISQLIRTQFWPNFEGRFLGPFFKHANCFGDPKIVFGPNIILNRNFQDQIFFEPNFFWPNLFWDPNFLFQNFSYLKNIFIQKFFEPKFFGQKFLRLKIYLWPQKNLDQQFFGTQSSFGPQIVFNPIFFTQIFWIQKIFYTNFFLNSLVKLTLTYPI